jgi:hypothetical protein
MEEDAKPDEDEKLSERDILEKIVAKMNRKETVTKCLQRLGTGAAASNIPAWKQKRLEKLNKVINYLRRIGCNLNQRGKHPQKDKIAAQRNMKFKKKSAKMKLHSSRTSSISSVDAATMIFILTPTKRSNTR